MSKKNKSWSIEEKLSILKENLVEGKPVEDICEAKGLSPLCVIPSGKRYLSRASAPMKSVISEKKNTNQSTRRQVSQKRI